MSEAELRDLSHEAQPDSVRAPSGQFSATERSLRREAPQCYRPSFEFSHQRELPEEIQLPEFRSLEKES